MLVYIPKGQETINHILGNGKRFMAYEIIKRLCMCNDYRTLYFLKKGVEKGERRKGQVHRMFESSSDIKPCYSRWFIEQKLDYIHFNPVSGKWNLVDDHVRYPHSSARFYELNEPVRAKISHYLNFVQE